MPSLHPGQKEEWAPTSWLPLQPEKAVTSAKGQQQVHKRQHTGMEGQRLQSQQQAVLAWSCSNPGEQEGTNHLCPPPCSLHLCTMSEMHAAMYEAPFHSTDWLTVLQAVLLLQTQPSSKP